jgi:uncharacterized protein YwgA
MLNMLRSKKGKVNGGNLSLFNRKGWNRKQKEREVVNSSRVGLIAVFVDRGGTRMSQTSESFLLGGILKRIGVFNPSRFQSDFNQRLVTQKTIYLLQAFGLYLGYLFTWYIRGPYSPNLTRDAYGLTEMYPYIPEVKFADSEAESRFGEFLLLLKAVGRDERSWEILASVHFLRHLNKQLNENELFKEFRSRKTASRELFDDAVELLKKYDLF